MRPKRKKLDIPALCDDPQQYYNRAEDMFVKKFICHHKGCGIFAATDIPEDTFLLEYKGTLLTREEGEQELLKSGPSFLFFVKDICILGDQRELCSMVNDRQTHYNSVMKIICGRDNRIGLFSLKSRPILKGEELTYSYGPGIENMPWRVNNMLPHVFEKPKEVLAVEEPWTYCSYCQPSIALSEQPGYKEAHETDNYLVNLVLADNEGKVFEALDDHACYNNPAEEDKGSEECFNYLADDDDKELDKKVKVKPLVPYEILTSDEDDVTEEIMDECVQNISEYSSQYSYLDFLFVYPDNIQQNMNEDTDRIVHRQENKDVDNCDTGRNVYGQENKDVNGCNTDRNVHGQEDKDVDDCNTNRNVHGQEYKDVDGYNTDRNVHGQENKDVDGCNTDRNVHGQENKDVDGYNTDRNVHGQENKDVDGCNTDRNVHGQEYKDVDGYNSDRNVHGQENEDVDGCNTDRNVHGQENKDVDSYNTDRNVHGQENKDVDGCNTNRNVHGQENKDVDGCNTDRNVHGQENGDVEDCNTDANVHGQDSKGNSSAKPKTRVRLERPCPFCPKKIKHFSEHLQNMHSNITEVKEIMKLKNHSIRKRKFRTMMVRGIKIYNDKVIGTKTPLMRLKKTANEKNIKYQCSNCQMFYTQTTIARHKQHCYANAGKEIPARGQGIQVNLAISTEEFLDSEFAEDVLLRLHNDNLKKEIESDVELIYIGNMRYQKLMTHRTNKRNPSARTRKLLRCLAHFKISYNNNYINQSQPLNMSEILCVDNWHNLKTTINKIIYTEDEDDEKKRLKRGTAVQLRDAITFAGQALKSFYTLYRPIENEKRLQIKNALNEFNDVYSNIKCTAFGSIGEINLERRALNRGAEKLPTKSELRKVIDSCSQILKQVTYEYPDNHLFVKVRRAVVTRLIFFNGRRPAEVSNLTIDQWALAKKDYYITAEQKLRLQESKFLVLENFKVIIAIGKSKDVPVVIPKYLWNALEFLASKEVRDASNVHPRNLYLFPSTRQSLLPSDGPDNIRRLVIKEKLEGIDISSVKVRRLIANEFAAIDFPDDVRKETFNFLGHSGEINKLHYCLPDLKNIYESVAPVLDMIDCKYENALDDDEWQPSVSSMPEEQIDVLHDRPNASNSTYVSPFKNSTPIKKRNTLECVGTSEETSNELHFDPLNSSHGSLLRTPSTPELFTTSFTSSSNADDIWSSDEESAVRRNRMSWTPTDEEIIESEFETFLSGQESYPPRSRINQFLKLYPEFLSGLDNKEKLVKLRVKLNNKKRLRLLKVKKSQSNIKKF